MNNNLKIVNIIPLTRLKNNLDFFSYLVPDDLKNSVKIGQLVEINFRNKVIQGVVLSFENNLDNQIIKKLKPIISIFDNAIVLQEWQLKLLSEVCDRYMISYSHLLKLLVPEVPKKKTKKINKLFSKIKFKDFNNSKDITIKTDSYNLIKYRFDETLASFIVSSIKNLKENEQIAIIFPRLKSLYNIIRYLSDFQTEISLFLPTLSKNRYYNTWLKVRNAESRIVIGTRSAIFAPYKNLKHIIIIDEEDENHKQHDPSPRYKVHYVAQKINELLNCKVSLLTRSPSVEALHRVALKELSYYEIDDKINLPKIKIIEAQKERFNATSPLSITLYDEVQNHKKVFLYLNKKGFYTGFYCFDCKKQIELNSNNCSKCKGVNIKSIGVGVHELKKEIDKLFPNKIILSLDSDTKLKDDVIEENVKNADIVIGTDFAKDFIDFSNIGLLGVISYDILSGHDEYNINEKQFSSIYYLISRLKNNQTIIIQTKNSQSNNLISLYNYNLKTFYQNEIQDRKLFKYPPFSSIIRITIKTRNISEVNEAYNKVKQIFQNCINTSKPIQNQDKYVITILVDKNLFFDKNKLRNLGVKIELLD